MSDARRTNEPDETKEDKAFRTAVSEGITSIDAGRSVPYTNVRRWLLSWGTEDEIAPPE